MAVGPARAPDTWAPLRARPDDRSHSPPRRATCLLPLGPIVHAAATPTGSQARAPIARIRTLALPLHPAVDRLLPRRQPLRPGPPGPASLEKQLFPVLQTNCFRERTPPLPLPPPPSGVLCCGSPSSRGLSESVSLARVAWAHAVQAAPSRAAGCGKLPLTRFPFSQLHDRRTPKDCAVVGVESRFD